MQVAQGYKKVPIHRKRKHNLLITEDGDGEAADYESPRPDSAEVWAALEQV
jgi:hypothetical protein